MIIGLLTLIAFILWEWRGAKTPVVPFRLFKGQRVVGISFMIAFIGGINYTFSLSYGATLLSNVFRPSPAKIGVYAIGPTAGLIVGATGVNILFAIFKGRARELLFVAAIIMSESPHTQNICSIDQRRPKLLLSAPRLLCHLSTRSRMLS